MAGQMLVVHMQWSEGSITRQETYGPWTATENESHLEQIVTFMKGWREATRCRSSSATLAIVTDPRQFPERADRGVPGAPGEDGPMTGQRRMFRYVVPVDDRPHAFRLTSSPVAAAVTGDRDAVEFWAESTGDPGIARAFRVFGTGHALPDGARWAGTCPRTPDGLVFHLYEIPGDSPAST